eukprot:668308-Rhodomonas_salina.1
MWEQCKAVSNRVNQLRGVFQPLLCVVCSIDTRATALPPVQCAPWRVRVRQSEVPRPISETFSGNAVSSK